MTRNSFIKSILSLPFLSLLGCGKKPFPKTFKDYSIIMEPISLTTNVLIPTRQYGETYLETNKYMEYCQLITSVMLKPNTFISIADQFLRLDFESDLIYIYDVSYEDFKKFEERIYDELESRFNEFKPIRGMPSVVSYKQDFKLQKLS